MALTLPMGLQLTRKSARPSLAPLGEALYGFYVGGGQITPITSNVSKSLGATGAAIQSMVRARRELKADDTGLALAHASAPTIFTCVEIRATKVAAMPHGVYRKSDKTLIEDHPLTEALKLARRVWGKNILYAWEHARCLHGENYLEIVPDGLGRPSALRWLNPLSTEPQIQQGRIQWFDYSEPDGDYVQFQPDQIAYDWTHNPLDDWRGLAPVQLALTAANIQINYLEFLNSWFKNDSTPGGILSARQNTTINKSDGERLLKVWTDQLQGARNKFRTILMPAALEYQQVQQKPSVDNVEQMRAIKGTICEALRVPISLVDFDQERFQLAEEQPKALYEQVVIPECEHIATEMTDDVLPYFDDSSDVYFGFDFDRVRALMSDQVKQATAINSRFLSGTISFNDARVKFGDLPKPDGDFYMLPKAQQPILEKDLGRVMEIVKEAQQTPQGQGRPLRDTQPDPSKRPNEERVKATPSMNSAFVYLDLANDPQIAAVQAQVRSALAGVEGVEWQAPDTYHVTLVYALNAPDEALQAIANTVKAASIQIGAWSLGIFDNDGEDHLSRSLHLKVDADNVLKQVQRDLYAAFAVRGLSLSPFSAPDAYQPHITLAYLPPGTPLPDVQPSVYTQSDRVTFGRSDYRPAIDVSLMTVAAKSTATPPLPYPTSSANGTVEDELRAWRKKALNSLKRARSFNAYVLPTAIANSIRADLHALPDTAEKATINAVFATAARELKSLLDQSDLAAFVDRLMESDTTSLLEVA